MEYGDGSNYVYFIITHFKQEFTFKNFKLYIYIYRYFWCKKAFIKAEGQDL